MSARLFALILAALPAAALAQAPGATPPGQEQPKRPDVRDLPFSKQAVLDVVSSHREEIQKCYEDAMKQRGATAKTAPRGRVVLAWEITPEGLTANVRIQRTEIRDELVTDCMVNAIRYWSFPRPQTRQPVEFPFDLQPAEGPADGKRNSK